MVMIESIKAAYHAPPPIREVKTTIGKIFNLVRTTQRGITADEIILRLPGVAPSTVSSALNRLKEKGHVIDSGNKRTTRYGRPAAVYVRR